jgi:hypothetical protein
MKTIKIHWTAGTYKPNSTDLEHYHYLIDDKGNVFNGKFKPEDNINCNDGTYAVHTGGGNTNAIGVSFCGMSGFKNHLNIGRYPLTEIQLEAGFKFIAKLCLQYKISVNPLTVMTHYEFGLFNPKTTSAGKIDIVCLPPYLEIEKSQVGDFIRKKIQWYINNHKKGELS